MKNENVEGIKYKRAIIAIFINAIFLYDDRVTIIFNASDNPVTLGYALFDETEKVAGYGAYQISYMKPTPPPYLHVKIDTIENVENPRSALLFGLAERGFFFFAKNLKICVS